MKTLFAMFAAAIVCVTGLGGCAGPIAAGESQQRLVYRAEGDFSAALPLAVAYDHLPDCVTGQVTACSSPLVRPKLNAAAKAARVSLSTAEALVRSKSAAAQVAAAVAKAQQDVLAFVALAQGFAK